MTTEVSAPKNIRISTQGNEICDALVGMQYYSSSLEAYRAALGVALALQLEPVPDLKLEMNKWDTGSVFRDPETNLMSLLALFDIGGSGAVTTGIQLAESGLRYLNEKRIANVDLLPILVGRATEF